MNRKSILTACLATAALTGAAVFTGVAQAQRPSALAFEVATVKPSNPAVAGMSIGMPPNGELTTRGMTFSDLVQFAYGLHGDLISGVTGWMRSERYDVVGRPEAGRLPSPDELKAMLRALLTDRFKLAYHKVPQETEVYVLTIGKSGSKMKERHFVDGDAPTSLSFQGAKLPGRGVPMAMLAEALQSVVLDRPVIDKTGLKGKYDFNLVWKPEPEQFGGRGAGMPSEPDAPNIFAAVQEQLGLRLDSGKMPVDSMVIDHAERPTAN